MEVPLPYAMVSYSWDSRRQYAYFFDENQGFLEQVRRYLRHELPQHPQGRDYLELDENAFVLGQKVKDQCEALVSGARALVFLWDRFSIGSQWCQAELRQWGEKGGLFPVCLEPPEECPESGDLVRRMLPVLYLELFDPKDKVPVHPNTPKIVAGARKLAFALKPYLLKPDRVRVDHGELPIFVCPSSGGAEHIRSDLLHDLPAEAFGLDPDPADLEGTLGFAADHIREASISIHLFGDCPSWKIGDYFLSELLLDEAISATEKGHRILVWIALRSPLRDVVLGRLEALPEDVIEICIGSRDELLRRVRSLRQRPLPVVGSGLLILGPGEEAALAHRRLSALGYGASQELRWGPQLLAQLREALSTSAPEAVLLAWPGVSRAALLQLSRHFGMLNYSGNRFLLGVTPTVATDTGWSCL